jgi:hypothetical protein
MENDRETAQSRKHRGRKGGCTDSKLKRIKQRKAAGFQRILVGVLRGRTRVGDAPPKVLH